VFILQLTQVTEPWPLMAPCGSALGPTMITSVTGHFVQDLKKEQDMWVPPLSSWEPGWVDSLLSLFLSSLFRWGWG
jgi:hypothetical protein